MKYLSKKDKSFKQDIKNTPVRAGDSRLTDDHWARIVTSNKSKTQKEKALLEALGVIKNINEHDSATGGDEGKIGR